MPKALLYCTGTNSLALIRRSELCLRQGSTIRVPTVICHVSFEHVECVEDVHILLHLFEERPPMLQFLSQPLDLWCVYVCMCMYVYMHVCMYVYVCGHGK